MNTIKVQIKTITIENCRYDLELRKKLIEELQDDAIINFMIFQTKIVVYVKTEDELGITMEFGNDFYDIDDIYNQFLVLFPNALLETIKCPTVNKYTDDQMAEINKQVAELQKQKNIIVEQYIGKRIPLRNISVNNGTITIFEEDNNIILLHDTYELDYSRESYDSEDGTVIIIRTEKPNRALLPVEDSATDEEVLEFVNVRNDIKNIIQAVDDVENGRDVEKIKNTVEYRKTQKEIDCEFIKNIINDIKTVEGSSPDVTRTVKISGDAGEVNISTNGNITISGHVHLTEEDVVENVDEDEELISSIGDTVVETIKLKVALISYNAFDLYAKTHNIFGWDLFTPTTVRIKYTEDGQTSEEKIKKFHEMMDSLDAGWIERRTNDAKFLSEFNQVLERDLVSEFISRVKKHNVFVRENLAKIRSSLLDIEEEFARITDEVNLTIDWESLTAFASKKERIEHRVKGVDMVFTGNNRPDANIIKVDTGYNDNHFYIPCHLITDEIREKYVLDNELLYIENVPEFAFYEICVNGHVMLIEKTDL